MADALNLDTIEETPAVVAEWLIAAYGPRLAAVSLSIEGHYGPLADCYGIVPITLERGQSPDGTPETRKTLPTGRCHMPNVPHVVMVEAQPRTQAMELPLRLVADFARRVEASDVTAHQRIELLRRYGSGVPDSPG